MNAKTRREFDNATEGMPGEAITIIERNQPYNLYARRPEAGPQSVDSLHALSALQNADKHRSLAVLTAGISHPRVTLRWSDEMFGMLSPQYVAAGEQLASWNDIGNRIPYGHIRIDVTGLPHVTVKIEDGEDYRLPDVAAGTIGRVRELIIPALEPFTRI